MKQFIVSGKTILVDDACAHYFSDGSKWACCRRGQNWYVYRKVRVGPYKYRREWLHRLIAKCPDGEFVDHIDGNGLNNRRSNLRICRHSDNMKNRRRHKNNASGFKGVYFAKDRKKNPWRAQITCNGRQRIIGSFASPEEAHRAYVREAQKLHGDFARAA